MRKPPQYIGHVVIEGKTYGILAHTVTERTGRESRRHFEGEVVDWQTLVREHVAVSAAPAEDKQTSNNVDWIEQQEGAPFDDKVPF